MLRLPATFNSSCKSGNVWFDECADGLLYLQIREVLILLCVRDGRHTVRSNYVVWPENSLAGDVNISTKFCTCCNV